MIYKIDVKEIWTRTVTVEATSQEEALQIANEALADGADLETCEYLRTLDADCWDVEEVG